MAGSSPGIGLDGHVLGPNFNDNKTMASEMTEAGQGQSSIGANVEQAAQQVAKAAAAPLMAVTGTVLNKVRGRIANRCSLRTN